MAIMHGISAASAAAKRPAAAEPSADGSDAAELVNTVAATYLTRDLINTPAQDMAPSHLQAEVEALGAAFKANVSTVMGDELLDLECGAIHAVGRAADAPPRLMDLPWGKADDPTVTNVG